MGFLLNKEKNNPKLDSKGTIENILKGKIPAPPEKNDKGVLAEDSEAFQYFKRIIGMLLRINISIEDMVKIYLFKNLVW